MVDLCIKVSKNTTTVSVINRAPTNPMMHHCSFRRLLLSDHGYKNLIISPEQAAGKKVVWCCTEQLLINKAIMAEVRKKLHNLFTI